MNQTTNTNLPIKVPSGLPPTDIIIDNHQDLSTKLSQTELDQLQTLPIETLDTIRSKLVQLIDAVTVRKSICLSLNPRAITVFFFDL